MNITYERIRRAVRAVSDDHLAALLDQADTAQQRADQLASQAREARATVEARPAKLERMAAEALRDGTEPDLAAASHESLSLSALADAADRMAAGPARRPPTCRPR